MNRTLQGFFHKEQNQCNLLNHMLDGTQDESIMTCDGLKMN